MIDSVEMIRFFTEFNTEPKGEILRFAQDDRRRGQGDKANGSE